MSRIIDLITPPVSPSVIDLNTPPESPRVVRDGYVYFVILGRTGRDQLVVRAKKSAATLALVRLILQANKDWNEGLACGRAFWRFVMMHEIPNKRDEYSWYLKMRQYVDFDGDEWAEMAQNGFSPSAAKPAAKPAAKAKAPADGPAESFK